MKNLDPEMEEEAIVADQKYCCGTNKRCEKTEKVVVAVAVAAARLIAYKDCRRNHAASIGGYAVDGCCEFMAAGEAGSSAAFICAACNCHRNFHRKVVIWRSHQASSGDRSSVSTSAKC